MAKKAPRLAYPIAEGIAAVFKPNAQGTMRWSLNANGESFNLSPTDALTLLTSGIEPVIED